MGFMYSDDGNVEIHLKLSFNYYIFFCLVLVWCTGFVTNLISQGMSEWNYVQLQKKIM